MTEKYPLTIAQMERCADDLREKERAKNTVLKYRRDLDALYHWLNGRPLTRAVLVEWKEHLVSVYAAASVNSMPSAQGQYSGHTAPA